MKNLLALALLATLGLSAFAQNDMAVAAHASQMHVILQHRRFHAAVIVHHRRRRRHHHYFRKHVVVTRRTTWVRH